MFRSGLSRLFAVAMLCVLSKATFASEAMGKVSQIAVSKGVVTVTLDTAPMNAPVCNSTKSYAISAASLLGKRASIDFFRAKQLQSSVVLRGLGTCSTIADYEDVGSYGIAKSLTARASDSISEIRDIDAQLQRLSASASTPVGYCANAYFTDSGFHQCRAGVCPACPTGTHAFSTVNAVCYLQIGGSSCNGQNCIPTGGNGLTYGQCCMCAP